MDLFTKVFFRPLNISDKVIEAFATKCRQNWALPNPFIAAAPNYWGN